MAFWNKRERRALTSGLQSPSDWMFDSLTSTRTSSGQRVTVKRAMGLIPVLSAVTLISEQVGQLPLKVYRSLGDREREEARRHRSWRLLHDRPNSQTPASRFWSTVALHILLYGNCFIEKRRDGFGEVEELWVLPPAEVTVKWWPNLMQKTYLHQPADLNRGRRELDDEEILHIIGPSLDGITGMSVIEEARTSLGTALAREEFEGTFYANGAVLSQAILMEKSVKSDAALKRLKESMVAIFGGSSKAHQIAVFEDGARPIPVGSPLKDLEFVASQNMSRTDIAILFHLPPNKLGGSTGDGLAYSTVEMNQTAIAIDAVAPLAKTISDALSQDPSLLPQNVFWAEFTLEGMLRADAESRANYYEKLVSMKAMLPEEVRPRENLPPLTAAQKKQLQPAPAVAAPERLPGLEEALKVNGNGNGNGPEGE